MTTRQRLVIVGTGGHARVIENLCRHARDRYQVVGCADAHRIDPTEVIGESRVVTTFDRLEHWAAELGVTHVALAVGDNTLRRQLFDRVKAAGLTPATLVHPRSLVEEDVSLGEGAVVCAGAIVCTQAVVGDNVIVNSGAIIDHETVLEADVHVGPGARLAGRVRIGRATFIGAGVTVRDRITIGCGTTVGAGAVVVSDLGDDLIAVGVPARVRDGS